MAASPQLAEIVREARRRAGVTGRELARRCGLPQPTLLAVERGRCPSHATLERLLAGLPELEAGDLMESATLGLLVTQAGAHHVRLRHGVSRGPHTSNEWELESIDAGAASSPTVRVVSRGDGPVVYDLRFEREAPQRISYRRRLVIRRQVATTRDAPHATRDARGLRAEALFIEPEVPTREALLEVFLPRGYWPDEVCAAATPRAALPTWHPEDLAPRLHDGPLRVEADPQARRLALVLERPLVGLRYVLYWFLRDA